MARVERGGDGGNAVEEGQLLWEPGPARVARARLTTYLDWLRVERGLSFPGYAELWEWSVRDLDAFWQSIVDHYEIPFTSPHRAVLERPEGGGVAGTRWFPGAQL